MAHAVEMSDLRAQLASVRAELAVARAQLAAPHMRAAARRAELLLRADPLRRVALDDVLQYVAQAGFTSDAASAFGACRDFWHNDEQMHWAAARARHGEHKMTRLMWASQHGLTERVVQLVEWSSDVNAQDARGLSSLHFAAILGRPATVRALLASGAKVSARTLDGTTPLHTAAYFGRLEVARLLLDAGARVDALDTADGAPPMFLAAQQGHAEVVRELLARGADVNLRTREGCIALHTAAGRGHTEVVRELLARGADVTARDARLSTPLHHAADLNRCAELRLLLRAPGADVEARNALLRTPLIVACMFGYLGAATVLVGAGASLEPRSNIGVSALGWALRRKRKSEGGEPEDAGGDAPPSEAQKEQHRALVAMLRALGAPA